MTLQPPVISQTNLPGCPIPKRGKVRDIYDLGDKLLLVATDRISVFDVVLPTPIPDKGQLLTQISAFWFEKVKDIIPNHMISTTMQDLPQNFKLYEEILTGRSMLAQKTQPLPVECIVRGYLSGSGWAEYKKSRTACGIKLPFGLQESSKLPQSIFTPSTKAETGHDQNITFEQMQSILKDKQLANRLRDISIAIYERAHQMALDKGMIIADTKFEFGLLHENLLLIDELLTPDSSRLWPKQEYAPGKSQKSFDKQFVRDYCASLGWDKNPPGPELSPEVVNKTRQKYLEAYRLLTN